MRENKKIFFTNNDFEYNGGGTLRMKAFLNVLCNNDESITLISNVKNKNLFNEKINHIALPVHFTHFEKRLLQFFISFLPLLFIDLLLYNKLKKLRSFFKNNGFMDKEVVFFEFLDNTVGYYLKKKGCVRSVCNDLHGIASNEFKSKESRNIFLNLYNKMRYVAALKLDAKVFEYVDCIIYASEQMREYYFKKFSFLENSKYYIIPYSVDDKVFDYTIDEKLLNKVLDKFNIKKEDNIIFYAGGFKEIGGVLDLIDAFSLIKDEVQNVKLFLLGKGNIQDRIEEKIIHYSLEEQVILAGVIPYEQLRTYQQIASVIVCPDRQNEYNHMIFPLKYPDSLLSKKPVIYGKFKTLSTLNKNEQWSIGFEPSNINDLAKKILYVFENKKSVLNKYSSKKDLSFFKYSSYYEEMSKLCQE